MDWAQLDVAQVGVGVAAGLVLAAVGWVIARRPARKETRELRQNLLAETERRSAAEAKLLELPKLETLVGNRDRTIAAFSDDKGEYLAQIAQLEADLKNEREKLAENLKLLDEAKTRLTEAFEALAAKALSSNNDSFLKLAQQNFNTIHESAKGDLRNRQTAIDELVKPLKASLEKVDEKIQALETKREGAYSSIEAQITNLVTANTDLRKEAANLAGALRSPNVRGRWGEIQLRRVLELSGMIEYCDFDVQKTTDNDGKVGRPDVIVKLPNNWRVAVDSKVPYDAFLEAVQATDDGVRTAKFRDHARAVRGFVDSLSRKAYAEAIQPSPDYVIMLIPGESFYYAAVEQDPNLLEYGAERKVLVVSPMALIGLLRAIHFGWSEEKLAENAREISDLAKQLYDRIGTFVDHFEGIGSGIESAAKAYDKAARSLKARVLVTTQRFKELGATNSDLINPPKEIEMPAMLTKIEDITPIVELPTPPVDNGSKSESK